MFPRVVALAVLCASLASPARAELQVFKGTFSLLGLPTATLPSVTAIGVATVNGSGGGSHVATIDLPGGLFSLHSDLPVTSAGTLPLTSVQLDVTLGAGQLDVAPGGTLSGVMPAPGNVRLCVFLDCSVGFNIPLTVDGTAPRGVGIGGPPIVVPIGAFGTLTLGGGVWETGVAEVQTQFGSVALTGFAHGPLSQTSSTADPQGVLQLVTPVRVGLLQGANPPLVLPVFGVLEVKLLPEPGALVALAAGAALLGFLGARRARR